MADETTARSACHSPEAGARLAPGRASASAAARARAPARPPAAARRARARARARKRRVGFEGGQNPIHMRMRKLRGPHMKKSMPFEKFRTHTQPVNLRDLERASTTGAEVTPETLREKGLATRRERARSRSSAGASSARSSPCTRTASPQTAREKIEAAGGTCQLTRGLAPVLRTFLNAFRVPEIRKKLAFTAAMLALYRAGAYIPAPGINIDAVKDISEQLRRLEHPRLPEPRSPAARCSASRSSRSGSCPTSRRRSSCSC